MKLYQEGKLSLQATLADYLPETLGTNKQNITLQNLLLHQAGLVPFIPFYKATISKDGSPLEAIYSITKSDSFSIEVADNLFMKNAWEDTIYQTILKSGVGPTGKYVYSDNDFIFLGKIVERIAGMSLDNYVAKNFYQPMRLHSIGYNPLEKNNLLNIAPTEDEKVFRNRVVQGSVHDPGAAMMGGVAGHAGVFSNAYDVAAVMQMLLNGGYFNGTQYLKKETIDFFTAYGSTNSRRGLGFDKPEKDNDKRTEPYPSVAASALTFGHTGFTGTCAWADPATGIVYVYLSNRIYPSVSTTMLKLNIRGKIMDLLYSGILHAKAEN